MSVLVDWWSRARSGAPTRPRRSSRPADAGASWGRGSSWRPPGSAPATSSPPSSRALEKVMTVMVGVMFVVVVGLAVLVVPDVPVAGGPAPDAADRLGDLHPRPGRRRRRHGDHG